MPGDGLEPLPPVRVARRPDGPDPAEAFRPHAALHADAFDGASAWDARSVAELMRSGSVICVEAHARSALVGFLLLRTACDEAEILTVCCAPKSRRLGIGLAMVDRAMREAKRAEIGVVFLEVAEGNGPAKALYDKAGFKIVGRRPGYYRRTEGGREDALVLRNQLKE